MSFIGKNKMTDAERDFIRQALSDQQYIKPDGSPNFRAIGRLAGVTHDTVQRVYREKPEKERNIEFPEFVTEGDEEESDEEILSRLRKAHDRKAKAIAARTWFPVKVRETQPYGILWFGDPHLGVNCDWPTLESHIEIAKQDGVYGGNIGDTTDNWPWTGRMARLWAEADISHKTEKKLAEWFMFRAGVKWLCWLGGNHDEWNGGTQFYKELGAYEIPVIDWRAQFTLVHDKTQIRIDAAHGRKGRSIYNPTHGTLRDAKFGEEAALYVTGHTHNFGLQEIEFAERKLVTWLAQISGYKIGGLYEKTNGFSQSIHGSGIMSIIYPDTGRVQCFSDPQEGAEFLKWLRR